MTAPLEDDKLQQYFDGELPEEEMSEVRAMLDESKDAQLRLDALGRLRELVNIAADVDAEEIDSEGMFANVQIGMRTGQSMRVIHGGRAKKRFPPDGAEVWKIALPVVAVAIAAAVLFSIIGPGENQDDGNVADGDDRVEETTPEVVIDDDHSEPLVHVEPPHGTEVVEVDFGDNTGTVFAVEGEAGEPIAVVWISDEPAEEVTQ